MIFRVSRNMLCVLLSLFCALQTPLMLCAHQPVQTMNMPATPAAQQSQQQSSIPDFDFYDDEEEDDEDMANKSRWQRMKEAAIDYYYISKMLAKKYLKQQRVREILLASLAGIGAFGGGFGLGYLMYHKKQPNQQLQQTQNANQNGK